MYIFYHVVWSNISTWLWFYDRMILMVVWFKIKNVFHNYNIKDFIVTLSNFMNLNFFLDNLITDELQYISLFKEKQILQFQYPLFIFLLKVPEHLFIKSTSSRIVSCMCHEIILHVYTPLCLLSNSYLSCDSLIY